MKLCKSLWKLSVVTLLAGSFASTASADVIVNLSGLDLNTQFNTTPGTAGAVLAPTGSSNITHSFTVNGLDVASDGSANDSVVFSYLVTASGPGAVVSGIGNPFSYGVDGSGDPPDNEIDPGESLAFSNLAASVVLGDSNVGTFSTDSANFNSFFTRFPGGGDVVVLSDGSGNPIPISTTPNGGGDDPYVFVSPQPAFTVASTGGNGFGVDTISATFDLRFTAIPEPSSIAMLSMAGLGLLVRRRK